jgi:hypothetical protein
MESGIQQALGAATRSILRPLVRILLRGGIPFAVFMDYVKRIYVDVAATEMQVEGRRPSIARTAVITGLTRKEVSRLWNASDDEGAPDVARYNRAARVLTGWVRDKRFADASGAPAALPFSGPTPNLSELVALHSGDMPPRAVLDELIRVGAVEALENNHYRLLARAYIPSLGEEEKIQILGVDVTELLTTIDHNLTCPPQDTFYQRKVSYDNLTADALPAIREEAAIAAQAILERLDTQMAAHDRDANPDVRGSGRAKVSLGIYYFEEHSNEDDGK